MLRWRERQYTSPMSKGSWKNTLLMAQDEALLAVKLYNEPYLPRAFEGFVVHMHLAWLYLLQARFIKTNIDFRVRQSQNPKRFEVIDGEHRTWDLARMVKERWVGEDKNPIRNNLEFFIKLRNRIEHRYNKKDSALISAVSGKSHALLVNFEVELSSTFGTEFSLANRLRFPVFIGTFTKPIQQTLLDTNSLLPSDMSGLIAEFEENLDSSVLESPQYSMTLKVSLEKVKKNADMAITFVHESEITAEEGAKLVSAGKVGTVIYQDRMQPVHNLSLMKPGKITKEVGAGIPYVFSSYNFQCAVRTLQIKPARGAADKRITKANFCVYDEPNDSYLYTPEFLTFLIGECKDPIKFEALTGKEPRPK